MKILIGKVSDTEKEEIRTIYNRKNSLMELAKSITSDDSIYERLILDICETNSKYQLWWNNMSSKYNWEKCDNTNYRLDFESCEVYLIQKS